jgi:hypothetical protein
MATPTTTSTKLNELCAEPMVALAASRKMDPITMKKSPLLQNCQKRLQARLGSAFATGSASGVGASDVIGRPFAANLSAEKHTIASWPIANDECLLRKLYFSRPPQFLGRSDAPLPCPQVQARSRAEGALNAKL